MNSVGLPDMSFIRSRIPIWQVAQALGLRASGKTAHCWRPGHQHGDRTASISFRKNCATCYVCDVRSLSTLDLVMAHEECGLLEAARWICARWDVPTVQKGKKSVHPERWRSSERVGTARFPFESLLRSSFWASLDDASRAILPALACFADATTGEVEISYRALARYSGKHSNTTISQSIKQFEQLGLLKRLSHARNGLFRTCGRYRLDWESERFQAALDSCHEALKSERDAERNLRTQAREERSRSALLLKSNTLSTRVDCERTARFTRVDCAVEREQQPEASHSTTVDCAVEELFNPQSLNLSTFGVFEKNSASDFKFHPQFARTDERGAGEAKQRTCYIHGARATWWKRGDDWVCALCHPDPSTLNCAARFR